LQGKRKKKKRKKTISLRTREKTDGKNSIRETIFERHNTEAISIMSSDTFFYS